MNNCVSYDIRYEAVFWEKNECMPVEKMHVKLCKRALGVHTKATNNAVMGEMGRYPIMINIFEHILNYWRHLDKPGYSTKLLEEAKNVMWDICELFLYWLRTCSVANRNRVQILSTIHCNNYEQGRIHLSSGHNEIKSSHSKYSLHKSSQYFVITFVHLALGESLYEPLTMLIRCYELLTKAGQ